MDITKIDTKGWSEEQIAKLETLRARAAELAERKAVVAAEEEASRNDPATILEAETVRQAAEEEALRLREREIKADEAYRASVKKHGVRLVARIRTEEGSIVLHAMPSDEFDELAKRLANLEGDDQERLARSGIRDYVDHPALPEFDAMVQRYPGLWGSLAEARNALATGAAKVTAGKG